MSPDVLRIYDEWRNYREKRGALPSASWNKTAEQLNEYSEKYGVEAVRKLVDQMIAEGQKYIYFDRLDRSPPRQTGQPQRAERPENTEASQKQTGGGRASERIRQRRERGEL